MVYKVAIFDDNLFIVNSLSQTINWEELNCTLCGVATDGIEALKIIRENKPEIVISDIMMPGFTGLELAKLVKDFTPQIKFIIITGYAEQRLVREAIMYGAFDFLTKPLDNTDLKNSVLDAISQIEGEKTNSKECEKSVVETTLAEVEQHLNQYSHLTCAAIEYVKAHFSEEITLTKMAEYLSITSSYFSSLFKKDTGIGFITYVTMYKLDKAKVLLTNPQNRVSEVGYKVGYKDYAYFFQVFKKYYGCSPGYMQRLLSQ